jgi:hypothetical protein
VDLGVVFSVHDQEDAHTPVFASGEGSPEDDEASACERVHERRVLVHRRLIEDPTRCPAGSGLAHDGEIAHALAITKWYSVERR